MKKIDAHIHLYNMYKLEYPWLNLEWLGPARKGLYRNFHPRDLYPEVQAAGIDKVILVNAAFSLEENVAMLTQAEDYEWIGAVVGWLPMLDHDVEKKSLERYIKHGKFRGIRLPDIQGLDDPDWFLLPAVLEGLHILTSYDMVLDVIADSSAVRDKLPILAEKFPKLKIVINHLGAPPKHLREMGKWAEQLSAASEYPNVYAKVSGLIWPPDEWSSGWTADDIKPYIDFAIEKFGAERLMFGTDWPPATLTGGYAKVWAETNEALKDRSPSEVNAILGRTAAKVYQLLE